MPFPQPSEYDDAIQNPATAFADDELRRGVNDGPLRFGMPGPVASGNFAVVYRFRCGAKQYAVKCFTRQPPKDQEQRFSSIHQHLLKARLACATGFQFHPQGIRVRGASYALLKMEWLDAPTLLDFAPKNLQNREKFRLLSDSFLSVCDELQKNQIAHGDLQHGNLLVFGDKLRIIDYDGMCVPGTAGMPSEEDGLPHYQHPNRRGGSLSPYLDHFSSLVIWTSLHALSIDPGLWVRYVRDEERLLFSKDDFLNPQGSAIFRELQSYGDTRLTKAVAAIREACGIRDLAKIPALTEVIASETIVVDPEWWRSAEPSEKRKDLPEQAAATEHKHGPPTWMQSDRPVLSARFGHPIIWDRLFAYAYAALVTTAGFGVFSGTVPPDALTFMIWVLGGLLGSNLLAGYLSTPAVVQKQQLARQLRQAYSKLAESEVQLKHWKHNQESLIEKQVQPMQQQEAKLIVLQTQARQRQAELDTHLRTILQTLNTERQQNDAAERQALQTLSNQARQLDTAHLELTRRIEAENSKVAADATAQLDELRLAKDKKKITLLKALSDKLVSAELARVPIRAGSVISLTETNVIDLHTVGIRYAADFINYSVSNLGRVYDTYQIVRADGSQVKIPGIGLTRAENLVAWRNELARKARQRIQVSLPQSVADEIEVEAEQGRQMWTKRVGDAKAEAARLWKEAVENYNLQKAALASNEAGARQTTAAKRETLNTREKQERQGMEDQKTAVMAPINREIWQLQSVINPARHQVSILQGEYQKQLVEMVKEHGERRSVTLGLEQEMLQFKNIRVGRYLARVFAFAGE